MIPWRMRQAMARPRWALERAVWELRAPFVFGPRLARLREPKRAGAHEHDAAEQELVRGQLVAAGFDVRPLGVDVAAYERYLAAADYARFPLYYDGGRAAGFHEKGLEHHLALELLKPGPEEVVVDVASQGSPAPDIYSRLTGARVHRQDLSYPKGLRDGRIGGDASSMPVPDGFASAIALHNAFEHFEGDSDARFVTEACRVLRPGGRMCIVPLFLASRYVVQTDPAVWPREGVPFEPDAEVACARGWRDRHGRFYDVPHLAARVRDSLRGARLTIFVVENAREIDAGAYLRFVALIDRQ